MQLAAAPAATPASSTVLKAFEVLRLFRHQPTLGASECARKLGVPRTTAHRILVSLEQAGAVQRTTEGRYELGVEIFKIGALTPGIAGLVNSSYSVLSSLSSELRLPAHLGIRDGLVLLYVAKVDDGRGRRLPTAPGITGPLHATALGKVHLAALDDDEVRSMLAVTGRRITPYTTVHAGALLEELAEIRATGFAFDAEESVLGISCIATAIQAPDGTLIAAISLPAPAERFGRPELARLGPALRAAATTIQARLHR